MIIVTLKGCKPFKTADENADKYRRLGGTIEYELNNNTNQTENKRGRKKKLV